MDRRAEDLSGPTTVSGVDRPHRPRDLAVLLLALGGTPPRARARDQQADRAGGELLRKLLDRVSALDPEGDALDAALASVVESLGEPTGPARAVALEFQRDWRDACREPGVWAWLVAEALERSERLDARGGAPRGNPSR